MGIQKKTIEIYDKLIKIPNNWMDEIMFQIFEMYIKEDDNVLEIGANVGTHTVILQKMVGENGNVFAFEPFEENIAKLKKRLDLNTNNVKIFKFAISNYQGEAQFKVFRDKPGTCGFIERPWYDKEGMEVINVKVNFIDNIKEITNVALIKIDIEGADFDAIKGSISLINKSRPLIIFEGGRKKSIPASLYGYTSKEFQTFFSEIDYELYDNLGVKFDFDLWDERALNDFIAIPKEKHEYLYKIVQISVFSIVTSKMLIT
ncbi:MAG: FkbM family methyltransferase, partial [Desulfuromusa sp.]|nr:FkbM family methyltransferase [Desulfuromusa sp.]